MLVSAIEQCESAITEHTFPPLPASHPSRSSQSTRLDLYTDWIYILDFSPAIHPTPHHVCMLMLLSSLSPPSPTVSTSPFSTSVSSKTIIYSNSANFMAFIREWSFLRWLWQWAHSLNIPGHTQNFNTHPPVLRGPPALGGFPCRTNSSMMPSISWFLSLPLKTLDGSEVLSGVHHDSLHMASKGKGCLWRLDECSSLSGGLSRPRKPHGVTEVKRKALLKSTAGSNCKEGSHQRSK